jgi:hypothetical protein
MINLTHDLGMVSEWISLAKDLRTFVARTLPSQSYFTRALSFWMSSSRPLATVTYLSRNLNNGSVNEFSVLYNFSSFPVGSVFSNVLILSNTSLSQATCWFSSFFFCFDKVTCYSLTSFNLKSWVSVLSVYLLFKIFSTLTGSPLHAGLSESGNFSIQPKYCEYLMA